MPKTKLSKSEFIRLAFVDASVSTYDDIAAVSGLKLNSVISRYHQLKKELKDEGVDVSQLRKLKNKTTARDTRKASEILDSLLNNTD